MGPNAPCSAVVPSITSALLIPSTSEVYGKGISVPFQEDDDLLTEATDKHALGIRV